MQRICNFHFRNTSNVFHIDTNFFRSMKELFEQPDSVELDSHRGVMIVVRDIFREIRMGLM